MTRRIGRQHGMSGLQAVLLVGVALFILIGVKQAWSSARQGFADQAGRAVRGQELAAAGGTGEGTDDTHGRSNRPLDDPSRQYDTPFGPMTDDEIAAQQSSSDLGWGIEVSAIPGGVSYSAVESAGAANGFAKTTAEAFAHEYGRTPGETNALQHAMWQALLAAEYGEAAAKAIGDQHEKWQRFGNQARRRDSEADLTNNEIGRRIGAAVAAEAAAARGRGDLPPDLVAAVRARIIGAFQRGELDLDGGGQGYDRIPPGVGPGPGQGLIHRLPPGAATPPAVTPNPHPTVPAVPGPAPGR